MNGCSRRSHTLSCLSTPSGGHSASSLTILTSVFPLLSFTDTHLSKHGGGRGGGRRLKMTEIRGWNRIKEKKKYYLRVMKCPLWSREYTPVQSNTHMRAHSKSNNLRCKPVITPRTLNQNILQLERLLITDGESAFLHTEYSACEWRRSTAGSRGLLSWWDAERLSGLLAAFQASADGIGCQLL